jgi:hypothetical protein
MGKVYSKEGMDDGSFGPCRNYLEFRVCRKA